MPTMPIHKFTFFFLNGDREVYEGETVHHAFKNGGYIGHAASYLDSWAPGDSHAYVWDKTDGKWVKNAEEPAA